MAAKATGLHGDNATLLTITLRRQQRIPQQQQEEDYGRMSLDPEISLEQEAAAAGVPLTAAPASLDTTEYGSEAENKALSLWASSCWSGEQHLNVVQCTEWTCLGMNQGCVAKKAIVCRIPTSFVAKVGRHTELHNYSGEKNQIHLFEKHSSQPHDLKEYLN
ncbi:hypothetical protein UY3_07981 [Chelonia mydas]|uniref:Uncharacterized protein n=1 Tax=Chelonia mydas TaxID=8469 RepID=M7C3D0_CHEMY|nr:hypothetical protein UY3_07981 [Chelonia mydas]